MHYKRTGVGHGVQALMEDESHNVGAQGVGEDSACARVLRLWQPCSLSAALSSAPTARRGRGGGATNLRGQGQGLIRWHAWGLAHGRLLVVSTQVK